MAEPFAGGAIYRFLVVVAQESNRVAFNIAALGCSVPGSSPIGSHLKLILPITSLTVRSNATSPSLISAFAELPLIITAFLRCERGTECPLQDSRKPAGAGLVYRRRLAPANPRPKIRGAPDVGGGAPADRHGVIRFQHRRKISCILIWNTLVPIAIRTASG